MFLVDVAGRSPRVWTHHRIHQGAEGPPTGGGRGNYRAVIWGCRRPCWLRAGTRSATAGSETRECCQIKIPALPERERAIAVADRDAAREWKGLSTVVRRDEDSLLSDHNVCAIVGDCDLELAVRPEIGQLRRSE